MIDKGFIIDMLDNIATNYSRKWSSEERKRNIENWFMILNDLTEDQLMFGFRKVLEDTGEFMPPVGKFRQMCISGQGALNIEDEGSLAWSTLTEKLKSGGIYIFKNTCIPEAVKKMGGRDRIYHRREEDTPFLKKEFIEYYIILRRQNRLFDPVLPDQHAMKGYERYVWVGFKTLEEKKELWEQIQAKKDEPGIFQRIQEKKNGWLVTGSVKNSDSANNAHTEKQLGVENA